MFQFIPVNDPHIVAIRVSGKLTVSDYEAFLPRLEERLREHEKISLMIEFDDFHGWNLAAMKEDIKFSLQHKNDFERIAIVGDKSWIRWMSLMAMPFTGGEVSYFNRGDFRDAWDWLRDVELSPEEQADKPLKPYKHIIVGVDFSPNSRHAARRGIELAAFYGAEIKLVHIVDESMLYDFYFEPGGFGLMATEFSYAGALDTAKLAESMQEAAEEHMATLVQNLNADKLESAVLTGVPKKMLVSYATAQKGDLIVLATQSKSALDALLGSTTHYVQSHAHCDVLAVPLN